MKIIYSQIDVQFRQQIEVEFRHRIEKLDRLLKRYGPDSIQLHGSLEKAPHKPGFEFSLHLALPTGKLYATGHGGDVLGSAKAAFAEIETQVKKHQEKLRKDYVWKRKRSRGLVKAGEVPPSP
jgi:ribosome-associated translation inhibitor RaiA